MRCSDAEEILKRHCPDFYDALVMNHERTFPLPDDVFDNRQSSEQLYWEEQLKTKYPETYPVYLVCELNAFVYFVGLEVEKIRPAVAAQLGNYRALRAEFDKDPSEENAHFLERYYPQAAQILVAKMRYAALLTTEPSVENYAPLVEKTLTALDRAVEYDQENYEAYLKYDPTLAFNVCLMLDHLIEKRMITEEELEGRSSGYVRDLSKERTTSSVLSPVL